jgi:low affinity Fe/Cu permease
MRTAYQDNAILFHPEFSRAQVNTGTSVITFLMVFRIQNTQVRDILAIQLTALR